MQRENSLVSELACKLGEQQVQFSFMLMHLFSIPVPANQALHLPTRKFEVTDVSALSLTLSEMLIHLAIGKTTLVLLRSDRPLSRWNGVRREYLMFLYRYIFS
jgi:hypothetical protein